MESDFMWRLNDVKFKFSTDYKHFSWSVRVFKTGIIIEFIRFCSRFMSSSAVIAAAGNSRVPRDGAAAVGWSVCRRGAADPSSSVSWGKSVTWSGSRSGFGQGRFHQTSCRQREGLLFHPGTAFVSSAAVARWGVIAVCFCFSSVLWKHDCWSESSVWQRHASCPWREPSRTGGSAFRAPFSLYTEVIKRFDHFCSDLS